MNTLQVRIDEKTKVKVQKILQKMGLDMSTAVKMYFHQIIQRQAIPFLITTENEFTIKEEQLILSASKKKKKIKV